MDSVIMIFQQSDLNEEVQGGLEGFGLIPNFPLIRPSGTFSLEGEGFASLFETVDSATSGKPCVQNDMRVG
ncbi:MAG: hypothetical protein QF691_08260 [SAR324 cluster bacterium]|jgi:hypothetical protein|nr:hypothetical protein [SAR324 cluster bacterium]|tara:strand:+ start:124 stop:336 length:213 start_codon:yes stop_codon:yes gene_type:complete